MSNQVVRCTIESGYFWLSSREPHYPHRRAVWGNRVFVRGPSGTNWAVELLKFRDFIRFSQNYFTQICKMSYWVISESAIDWSLPEKKQAWGNSFVLWDTGRAQWPANPVVVGEPYRSWSGGSYRGSGQGNRLMPPSVSYRYRRVVGISGRGLYGYLRCVEMQFADWGNQRLGERLPFHVHPSRLANLHSVQITEPLNRSGMVSWHNAGSSVREVAFTFREGVLAIHEVSGYQQGIVTTTARNFSLRVV